MPPPPAPMPLAPWHVRLLGDVTLARGARRITHLPSRAATALLARLALHPERAHGREELIELLWPGVSLPVGRNRLSSRLGRSSLSNAASSQPITAGQSTSTSVNGRPRSLSVGTSPSERYAMSFITAS